MAFNALYGESMKIAQRNMELKNSIKKVTLEKEALMQRVASMENEVASLQEQRKINASLKEDLVRQKDEHTMFLKEKEGLLKIVDQSLKAHQLATSMKRDSLLKRRSSLQLITSTSQACHACGKLGHISIM